MGSNNTSGTIGNNLNQQMGQAESAYGNYNTGIANQQSVAQGNAASDRNAVVNAYSLPSSNNPASTTYQPQGMGGSTTNSNGSTVAGSTTQPNLSSGSPGSSTNLNSFMPTGLQPNSNGTFNLASTGSTAAPGDFSAATGAYQNLASTGGVNGAAIQAAEGATNPAFYSNIKNQMATQANTQGGYSPGFNSQTAAITRQQGQDAFNNNLQTQAQITELGQQGMEAGAAGLAGIAGQGQQNNQYNAGLTQQNSQYNTGLQQALGQQYQQGQETSAAGLGNVLSNDTNANTNLNQQELGGLGGLTQAQLNNLNIQAGSNNGLTWGGVLQGGATAAAGAGW